MKTTIKAEELNHLLAIIREILGRDPTVRETSDLLNLISQMQGETQTSVLDKKERTRKEGRTI